MECLKELIAAGANVNIESTLVSMGKMPSPLNHSVREGDVECIKELLKAGANIRTRNQSGDTPLIIAVNTGNKEVVQLLIEANSDINAENNEGQTALYQAVTHCHLKVYTSQSKREHESDEKHSPFSVYTTIAFMLLKAGAHLKNTRSGLNPSRAHLNLTNLKEPDFHIFKILLAAGADIEGMDANASNESLQDLARIYARQYLKQCYPESNLYSIVLQLSLPHHMKSYLLFYTLIGDGEELKAEEKDYLLKTSEGDVESVLCLMQARINVNVQDENGMSALMIASVAGNVHMLERLIRAGIDKNIQDLHGDTALTHAVRTGKLDCVEKLLKFGANIDIKGRDGFTALMRAVNTDDQSCWEDLVNAGANPNIPNDMGMTPLMLAIRTSLDWTIRVINAGANIHLVTKNGKSAVFIAAFLGKVESLKMLVKAGTDVNNKLGGRAKPLPAAAFMGHEECMKELIAAGADLNIQDEFHRTALKLAANGGFYKCLTTLLTAGDEVDTAFLVEIVKNLLGRFQSDNLFYQSEYCHSFKSSIKQSIVQKIYLYSIAIF